MTRVHVIWLALHVGAIACLPFAGELGRRRAAARGRVDSWWMVYLGVLPTAMAFTTYAYALKHLIACNLGDDDLPGAADHHRDGLVFLDEVPPTIAYVGGALALVGVAIARRKPRRAPTAELQPVLTDVSRTEPRASRGTRRGCGSTPRATSATPTPCGWRTRSRARGSC